MDRFRDNAAHWRERGRELRDIAEMLGGPTGQKLLEMAAEWEHMADRLDTLSVPSPSPGQR